ncbi:dipeptide and tripeptide permease A, partial [Escherichia coli 0.1304]
NSG